jgi:hypothetical protein
MKNNGVDIIPQWSLLANGSAGPWFVDIDESQDGTTFNMQIDGPAIYVAFELDELPVLRKLLSCLRAEPDSSETNVRLGKCNSLEVSIVRDNEVASRWFVVLQENTDQCVRLTLDAEMFAEALQQAVDDLPR